MILLYSEEVNEVLVNLSVNKNVVKLNKSQTGYRDFVSHFLIKFEEVKKIDIYNSTKNRKVYKTVKERRELYTDCGAYITFPRGVLTMIPQDYYNINGLVDSNKINVPIDQEEIKHSLSSFDLRDDQILAVSKCLLLKRGVVQLPTATGKSAIIASIIKEILKYYPETKILVLSPTLSTVKSINSTFLHNSIPSKIFGHPDKTISSPVTTSLVQSLVSFSQDSQNFLEGIDAVFYDECLPSNSNILLPDGSTKTIGEIYEDESVNEVMSYNIETKNYEIKKILRKFKTPFNDKFWKVYYENPITGTTEGVTLTSNHKVYTKSRGYVPAAELTTDDFIKIDFSFARYLTTLTPATFLRVKRVSPNIGSRSKYKYNLEVEDNHNYFASGVLVSNCHHLKCETWNQLNSLLTNVEYSIGFSALSIDKSEIYETDIRNISYETSLIIGCSGKVVMHMDPSYYIEKGIIALPIVFRVNNLVNLPDNFDESNWSSLSKIGLMSTPRTIKIAKISKIFRDNGRKSLILISEKDYAFNLGKYFVEQGLTDFGISFGAGQGYIFSHIDSDGEVVYDKVDSLQVLDDLSQGKISTVIGTSHIDEGVDLTSLDCLILASGGKKDRRVIQRVGRVLRKSKTGKYAYIVDFTDEGSRVLSRQSRERLKMYKDTIGVPESNLFDRISVDNIEEKFKKLEGLI